MVRRRSAQVHGTVDVVDVSRVRILRWRSGSWRFSSRTIRRRFSQVSYMVDVFYGIFVIALEAGWFV